MKAAWEKRLQWQFEAMVYSMFGGVLRIFPARVVFSFGEFVGKMIWPFMRKRRVIIRRNLRIVHGGTLGFEAVEAEARRTFVRSVANLVSSAFADALGKKAVGDLLEVANPEVMRDAIARGRGVVLLLSHMGNWELLTRLRSVVGKDVAAGAFYRPLNNPILDARTRKKRERDGTQLFSKRDSLLKVARFVKGGAVIGVLVDQRVGRQGEVVEFFGRLTRASPLPGLLIRRCGCEVLALSMETTSAGKWRVQFHPVTEPYGTQDCMSALEKAMKISVQDVFWLQERWKTPLRPEYPIRAWLGEDGLKGRVPHRAVLWLEDDAGGFEIPEKFQHPDVSYEVIVGRQPGDIAEIDAAKALPIDFILVYAPDEKLRSVAQVTGITVVELDS